MFENRLLENVKEGEEVIALVRRTPAVTIGPITLSVVLIIAPFFLLYPLLKLGPVGGIILMVSILVGAFYGFRTLWVQQLNAFILTNDRIVDVDQRGLFHRIVSETTYDKVQDVSYAMHGIAQTIGRYGSVLVQTAGTTANLEITGIRSPQKVHELILKLQRESTSSSPEDQLSADELIGMIKKIKAGVGEEQFRRLIANRPTRQV